METKVSYETELNTRIQCERAAVKLQNNVGKLLLQALKKSIKRKEK